MIAMWLGFWLFSALGGNHDSWWGLPFFVTFFVLVIIEVLIYGFVFSELTDEKRRT